jgi:hypothetical protein
MTRVRVILEDAKVYRQMDNTKNPLAILPPGREFDLGKVHKDTELRWVDASLPDGRKGYVTGTTKLRPVYPVNPSKSSPLYKTPDQAGAIVGEVFAGSKLHLLDVVGEGEEAWSLVRLPDGSEGYLPPEVKFKREEKKKKRSPGQYAVYGSAAVLAGIFLRRFTAMQASNSVLTMIAWAAILGGGALIIYSFFLSMRADALKNRSQSKQKR